MASKTTESADSTAETIVDPTLQVQDAGSADDVQAVRDTAAEQILNSDKGESLKAMALVDYAEIKAGAIVEASAVVIAGLVSAGIVDANEGAVSYALESGAETFVI